MRREQSEHAVQERFGRPALPPAVQERLESIGTIVLDAVFIATAVVARSLLLLVLKKFAPDAQESWALVAVSWISDVGLVGTTGVTTAFDLSKRVIRAAKGLEASLRS